MNDILECTDLIKIYSNSKNIKVSALRGISLSIAAGSIVTFVGPSGAGKSTLLRILSLIESFSSGEIQYTGEHAHLKYSEAKHRDKLRFWRNIYGFMFQLPDRNVFSKLTSSQNIMLPMKINNKLSRGEQIKRTKELLTLFNIEKISNSRPNALSGGELQRLGLCISLANDPDIIFADEPTGELDTNNKLLIMDYFKELNKNLGKTVIIVSHDARFQNISDKIFQISNGRISNKSQISDQFLSSTDFLSISNRGELTLPLPLLQRYHIDNLAVLEIKDNYLTIRAPLSEDESLEGKNYESTEFVHVTKDGCIILSAAYRKRFFLGTQLQMVFSLDYITLKPIVQHNLTGLNVKQSKETN